MGVCQDLMLDLNLGSLFCQVSTVLINRAGPWLGSDGSRFLSAARKQTYLKSRDHLPIIPLFLQCFLFLFSAAKLITAAFYWKTVSQLVEFSEHSAHLHSWRRRTGALRGNTSTCRQQPQGHGVTVGSKGHRMFCVEVGPHLRSSCQLTSLIKILIGTRRSSTVGWSRRREEEEGAEGFPIALCFNFDTKNVKIFYGSKETQFGYTVQQHEAGGSKWLLVGAPSESTGKQQTGDVYKCPLDTRNSANCSRLNLGKVSLDNVSESKDKMKLGMTLTSNPKDNSFVKI
ncbi:hypothetical protein PAMP_020223 [Pampus punctatissimus]